MMLRPARKGRGSCSWRLRLCGALLGLTTLSQPASARPLDPSTSATERAKQEVLTALSVGNPGHAEEILDRSFRADPDPYFLYQLGLVAQAQGRAVAALDLYRRYQEIVGAAVAKEITTTIEHFAAGLSAPVSVIHVTAAAGMLLCVDDHVVGVLPLRTPLLLAGGTHRFRLERRAEQHESGPLSIPDGREAELRLTPGARGTAVALLSLSPIMLFAVRPATLSPAVRSAVASALAESARKNHQAPLLPNRQTFLLSKRPAGCLDDFSCQFSVAEQAQARSLLRVVVKTAAAPSAGPADAPAGCSVELEYLDINTGQVAATGATESAACVGPPLVEALSAVMQKLISDADARPRGMVSIISVPEGAQVRVDGLLRGQTPYLKASFTGSHEVSVEKPDFNSYATKVEVLVGNVASIEAALVETPKVVVPEPPPAPPPAFKHAFVDRQLPRPRWRRALGGVAIGSGIVMGGFGVSALLLNGVCTQDPVNGGVCDAYFNTTSIGGGLMAGGAALSIAGIVLLAVPGPRERVPILVPSGGADPTRPN